MPKPSYTNNDVIAEYLKVNVIDLLNECYMYILVNVHWFVIKTSLKYLNPLIIVIFNIYNHGSMSYHDYSVILKGKRR